MRKEYDFTGAKREGKGYQTLINAALRASHRASWRRAEQRG